MNEDLIQDFGFSEMYEWSEVPENRNNLLGKFVEFDPKKPEKIRLAQSASHIIGVTTVNTKVNSDDPKEWKYKNMCNEYGDLYLQQEDLAVGEKKYDQSKEIPYIETRKWSHLIPIPNKYFDSSKEYVKRTNRIEWIRVNLLGKVIVTDNGQCKGGEYCTPYKGKEKEFFGIAVPAEAKDKHKFYVLGRLSEHTILILNK